MGAWLLTHEIFFSQSGCSVVTSRSNGQILQVAAAFVAGRSEVLAILPGRLAGEGLAQLSSGNLGLHRITLIQMAASLARPEMAQRGLAPISGLGLEAVAGRVAHEAVKAQELKYFDPVAALPGFARALAKTIGELRLARIVPEDLAGKGLDAGDLARLLLRYQDELHARSLVDLAGVLELATDAAKSGHHHLLGLPLLLLDVPLETRAHRELLQAIAARSREVLAIVAAEDSAEHSGAASAEDFGLQHLRRHLFSPSPARARSKTGFEMFSAPGEGLESVEIARRILKIAGEGVALDEIAILLRSPERYQPMIEDALRRARIPAWFSRGTARPDPAGRAFLALLACAAEKSSASRFAEYLSLGQVPDATLAPAPEWVPPEDELLSGADHRLLWSAEPAADDKNRSSAPPAPPPTPAAWEKLLVDAAVIGGRDRWVRRLNGLQREFELRLSQLQNDETRRQYLETQLKRLRSLSEFALPVIERLDSLPKSALWREWIGRLSSLARASLSNPDGVLALLAELEPMGDVGPVPLDEVAEVLSERLRFLRAEPPARRWGRVFVGSIDEVRGCEFSVVFLPGLAEGLFPQRALEDPLLLDHVRRELSSDLLLRPDRNNQERERLHLAVAATRDGFIASYPRMDVAEARPRVPSFYALELPRALEGALPKLTDFEDRAREAAPARLNWPAPPSTDDAIDDAEFDLATLKQNKQARYLMEVNEHLARSLRGRYVRWKREWKEADGLIASSAPALEALAAHRLTARAWSPSSLEQFAICPYRFALHGIHKLRPREEAAPLQQMDPLTRGALFHEVQRRLLAQLKQEGRLPLDREHGPQDLEAALTACNSVLDQVAAEYNELLAPAIERVWKSEIEDLRTDLRGWLQQMAQNDTGWEPLHFEFSFGLEPNAGRDPASVMEEAILAEGVRLRGSIDLVERELKTGVLRVTDHKSGRALESPPLYVGKGRVLQPLLYAAAAEQILNVRVESARLFYATQRGAYQQFGISVSDRALNFLTALLEKIDGTIAAGFLPPFPDRGACTYCDYRIVCGPYEEMRTARTKNGRDPRLAPLIDIRSMG